MYILIYNKIRKIQCKKNRLYCMRSVTIFVTIALIINGKNKLYIAKLTILYIARRVTNLYLLL